MTFDGSLASLLFPGADPAAFFLEHWQRRPLHVAASDPGRFATLFSLEDLDDLVRFTVPLLPGAGKLQMGIKGLRVPPEETFDIEGPGFAYAWIRACREAVSLVFNYLQDDNVRVRRMAQRLGRDFAGRLREQVNVNAYLTPGRSWLGLHRDSHDEINLQVVGSKHWRVFEPDVRLPIPGMVTPDRPPASLGPPCLEIDLRPGDVLYVPRGFWHDPVNSDAGLSLGLTVGLTPLVWSDVLVHAVHLASAGHEGLRHDAGPAADAPESLAASGVLWSRVVESVPAAVSALRTTTAAEPQGEADFGAWPPILSGSRLRAAARSTWRLTTLAGSVRLEVDGRPIGLRLELRDALAHIHQRDEFAPEDLPGRLGSEERRQACRLLLRFGAVEAVT